MKLTKRYHCPVCQRDDVFESVTHTDALHRDKPVLAWHYTRSMIECAGSWTPIRDGMERDPLRTLEPVKTEVTRL